MEIVEPNSEGVEQLKKHSKFVASALTSEEIGKAIASMQSIPKTPIKVKMNGDWLQELIDKGFIRKEDYKENDQNFFGGIRVEITDEVEQYEFVYES